MSKIDYYKCYKDTVKPPPAKLYVNMYEKALGSQFRDYLDAITKRASAMLEKSAVEENCFTINIPGDPDWVPEYVDEKENNEMPPKENQDVRFKYTYIPPMYQPKQVIYNPPATIVFWKDGTKTIVKCSEGDIYNKYFGFCAALAKKLYGNNNRVNKIVNDGLYQSKKEKKKDGETDYKELARKIMTLKQHSHCSYAEIARRMNMSYDAVRRIVKEEVAKCRKKSK